MQGSRNLSVGFDKCAVSVGHLFQRPELCSEFSWIAYPANHEVVGGPLADELSNVETIGLGLDLDLPPMRRHIQTVVDRRRAEREQPVSELVPS